MMDFDKFLSTFPPTGKEAWLEQIKKDLKDRPLEELVWQAEPGLQVSPLVHTDDFKQAPQPLTASALNWEICEDILSDEPLSANNQALNALQGGAEGLCFHLGQMPGTTVLDQLFSGIHLDYIGLHFGGAAARQNPGALAGLLQAAFSRHGYAGASLRGSIHFNPFAGNPQLIDWRYAADYIAWCREQMPGFCPICLDLPESDDTATALATLLQNAATCLQQLKEKGAPAHALPLLIQVSISVGEKYFLEIAKIRALKILWINLLQTQSLPLSYPVLEARFRPSVYTGDLYTNMIRSSTMAMSAVIGGVNRMVVLPYEAGREAAASYPPAFGRRIARNVQHLLKMESHLDEISDAAAGSCYVETLTRQLAEKAWEKFVRP